MFAGSKVIYTTEVTRNIASPVTSPTIVKVSTNAIVDGFGLPTVSAIEQGLAAGSIKFYAKQGSSKSVYSTSSYGAYGFWFSKSGIALVSTNTNRRIACKYEDGSFNIVHDNSTVKSGDTYSFAEMFIHDSDTIQYSFRLTMGDKDSYESDQPAYREIIDHRADIFDSWPVKPLVKQNDHAFMKQNYIQVMAGDDVTFSAEYDESKYSGMMYKWANRKGKSLRAYKKDDFTLKSVSVEDAGYYTMTVRSTTVDGKIQITDCLYFLDVQTEDAGTPFSWEGRVPKFSHDWKSDATFNYGNWQKPTKVHSIKKKNGKAANQYVGEWWSAFWGDNLNKEVGTDEATVYEAAKNMIEKYDDDFAYIRDYMGWPPDLNARKGYKSFVYIFGSGLANDDTSNTEKGGYQAATSVDGGYYACVWASYYPFSRFRTDADKKWSDGDYQREAMIHEGIHAIFADLDACKSSSWFHEAGNTWLQSAMNTERYNKYGTPGFLDACPLVAPFMPIECYSGWLLDGSFGGPGAQGVNLYGSDGQVCTWRNLLGGTQYGNSFPIILGEICGKGSIPWIWRNCSSDYCGGFVLKGIGKYLGEETMRELILQYRARQTTFDIGGWKAGYRKIMNDNIGVSIKEEYGNGVMTKDNKSSDLMPCSQHVEPFKLTPYQSLKKNDSDNWLAPDTLTNPGWSGANIIPIHVDSKANKAVVEFRPEDTEMRAQLCYVTKDGKNYYSQPVHCGKMTIDITDRPANNVIFAVICNTDYIFVNNEIQRKHHWDYRLRFGEGALQVANSYIKWSLNEQTLTDPNYNEDVARNNAEIALGIDEVNASATSHSSEGKSVRLLNGQIMAGQPLCVQLNGVEASDVTVNIIGLSGVVADNAPLQSDATYALPANLRSGLYFVKFIHNGKSDTYKVVIK